MSNTKYRIVNLSLSEGNIPECLKRALVTPLIKKANADPDIFKNYRPISNLPFLFKTIERVASQQIQDYVNKNNLNANHQSAYRKYHSTETALVRVTNDILRAVDNHHHVILVLLDLSAAFYTLDHSILLQRFQKRFGITCTALRWMESYFNDRQFSGVLHRDLFSGQWLSRSTQLLSMILSCHYHGLKCMIYADDTKYISVSMIMTQIVLCLVSKSVSPTFEAG